MKRDRTLAVARGIGTLVDPGTVTGLSEPQVLARFVERGDAVAFEAIVLRYGPMVLSVCRQVLRDANDVDDSFQATFLTLIRKAARLKQPERLGPWLYGVAYRIAIRARKRRKLAGLPQDLTARSIDQYAGDAEQLAALHDEIQRLPEKYRLPIVLCCIADQTHDEVARKLDWPIGTVHGRLSRGRELLRARLGRRGILDKDVISRLTTASSKRSESAVPAALLSSTLAHLSGKIPANLQTLVRGVLSAMFIDKLKSVGIVVAVTTLGMASAATALMAFQGPPAKPGALPAIRKSQERDSGVIVKALGKPPSPPVADEAAEEHAAEEVGQMRANVEMLELKCETIRSRIHKGIVLVDQMEDSLRTETPRANSSQAEQDRKLLEVRIDEKKLQIAKWQEEFLTTRVEIARLSYRIARTPQSLAESERDSSGKTTYDLLRRIDRLEAKVDRLADSIARDKAR